MVQTSTLLPSLLAASMPLLTTTQAHLSALALTLSYVGSLYLSRLAPSPSSARPVSLSTDDVLTSAVNDMTTSIEPVCMDLDRARSEASLSRSPSPAPGMRDHPDTIRARIKAVIGSTIASWVGVWGVVRMGLGEGGKVSNDASIQRPLSRLLKSVFASQLPFFPNSSSPRPISASPLQP